jgi:hypothetical protein
MLVHAEFTITGLFTITMSMTPRCCHPQRVAEERPSNYVLPQCISPPGQWHPSWTYTIDAIATIDTVTAWLTVGLCVPLIHNRLNATASKEHRRIEVLGGGMASLCRCD